jgi:iron complex outermembrane receptor protein
MRKILCLSFIFSLLISAASAQKVTGIVKDQQGKGLEKSTVSLLRAKDSSVVKLSVTSDDGHFSIPADAGSYLVSISHVGYAKYMSKTFEVSTTDVTVNGLELAKADATLGAVTVTAQKPMVEVKADKMIVNVEGTINAVGNDALELLRKSPGVMVDKDDNITL